MSLFVDASVLIALIAGEIDADQLADRMETDPDRLCSAVAIWETVAELCRGYRFEVPAAQAHVRRFLGVSGIRLVPIGARELELATDAHARFGRGRHPAALNMGDCFAYACAKANQAVLLYKGDDFSRTDLG